LGVIQINAEQLTLQYTQVAFVKVLSKKNPVTEQYVEILVQMIENIQPDKNRIHELFQTTFTSLYPLSFKHSEIRILIGNGYI
jgi:hypothetical protein